MQGHDPQRPGRGPGELLCLYGIVRAGDRPSKPSSPPLDAIVHGRLAALVECVPAEEFQPEILAANLGSIEWVTRAARRHEAMLEEVMQAGPVIPARLCTLFSGSDAVCELLAGREDALAALLERLAGREERGLKIHCDELALRRALAETDRDALWLAAAAASASPGQAYLFTRRRDALLSELAERRIEEVQDFVLDAIEALDVDVRIKPVLADKGSNRTDRMILNLAALVERDGRPHLDELLDGLAADLRAQGFSFEQSGPWPPYSFAASGADIEAA